MSKTRPYYAEGGLSAAFYDVVTAFDTRLAGDDAVYAALAPAGGSILELGSGTGRIAILLAERGFQVVGVDIAPAMLAQAQTRIAGLPPEIAGRIQFRRGDMTELNLKRDFDLVICPFFALAHLPAGAAWRNTFAVTARHLPVGGRAAFHLPRLDILRASAAIDPTRPVLDRPLEDGRRLLLFVRERSFREGVNRFEQVLDYAVADPTGRVFQRSAERMTFYVQDPEPLAATAGLVLDADPIDHHGVGDIWVFRKA